MAEKSGRRARASATAPPSSSAYQSPDPNARIVGIERNPDVAAYARRRGHQVTTADILTTTLSRYDLIIGNPPFRYADDFIPRLIRTLRPGGVMAFVLRLNYLGGQDRYERIWQGLKPAAVYPLPARSGLTQDGKTDATDYCVITWVEGYAGPTILRHLDNRQVANRWTVPRGRQDPRRRAGAVDGLAHLDGRQEKPHDDLRAGIGREGFP